MISEDIIKRIIRYNLRNPKILRYIRDENLASAQLHQTIMEQIKMVGSITASNMYIQNITGFIQNNIIRPIPYPLFIDIYGSELRIIIDEIIRDPYFRGSMYFVNFLTVIFSEDNIIHVYLCKKGKKHVYLCFYDDEQNLKYILEFKI